MGGLIIGIWLHGLGIEEAANTYFLLSVGDGLVAQIPSLLLAIATAIIVTRVSETQNLGEHISKQMNLSRAWLPVSGVLILIGIVPGMPNTVFLIAGFGAALASFQSRRSETIEEEQELEKLSAPEENESEEKINLSEIADNSPISVQLGYGLIGMVDEESGGPLVNRITGIRKQVSKDLGFIIPAVRVKDDLTLPANQYRIRVGQTIVGEDTIYPDRKLAIPGDSSKVKISCIEVIDPSFGMEAIWIESHKKAEAEANGYMVVEPESVLATHFSRILFRNAGKLIGQDLLTDLAIIKLEGKGPWPKAKLGDSSKIEVGDWAIAVGNPFGLENTVTLGIISNLNRNVSQLGIYDKKFELIQTDAAINPGNSGGPLLNSKGEVIGINTLIRSGPGAGLSFAIPINKAKNIASQLIKNGKVIHPMIGINLIDENYFETNESIVKVGYVVPNSPAAKSGIFINDIILKVGKTNINNSSDVINEISNNGINKFINITLKRKNKIIKLKVKPIDITNLTK